MAHRPFCLLITLTLAFQLIVFFSYFASARTPTNAAPQPKDLVRSSCEHASYPNICIRTLSSYTGPAKNPKDLAQAAVKVSLSRAKRVSNYLAQVSEAKDLKISKRQRGALSDCVEQISESVEELRQTLSELKHLRVETFRWQMSNAETWVSAAFSAALTYEDTCLDGFQGVDGNKLKSDVKRKIRNVGKVTSNALYMINRLDESRGKA
ncbi:pectinesterase inhibitor 3 [Quercus suber]|uniref:Pectinesterase inhibitor 3 n=1 Tax=Quercus suber TaxID=58331 RepID=A0AAW0LBV7_QUESU